MVFINYSVTNLIKSYVCKKAKGNWIIVTNSLPMIAPAGRCLISIFGGPTWNFPSVGVNRSTVFDPFVTIICPPHCPTI